MARNRKLITDQDLLEAIESETSIRVFENDHVVDSGGIIVRFTDEIVVIQSEVSQITHYDRTKCEFYEMRKR